MPHICVSQFSHHWFRNGLLPSHYLNQCWVIVNWTIRNKLQRNFNQNEKLFMKKIIWQYRLRNGGHFVHMCVCVCVARRTMVIYQLYVNKHGVMDLSVAINTRVQQSKLFLKINSRIVAKGIMGRSSTYHRSSYCVSIKRGSLGSRNSVTVQVPIAPKWPSWFNPLLHSGQ